MKYAFLVSLLFGLVCGVMSSNNGANTPKILDKYLVEEWNGAQATGSQATVENGNRIVRPTIHYWLKTTTGDKEVGRGEWERIILR